MARIAYVDHSYHSKTLSTQFIPRLISRCGHVVDFFWDESWQRGAAVPWSAVCDYDAIIMFQSFCAKKEVYFRNLHPNVTYIPMLDQFGIWNGPFSHLGSFWEPFQGCKTINFSFAAHAIAVGFGIKSLRLQYFQPPLPKPSAPKNGLHGFFWLRREEQIPWQTLRMLICRSAFDSMHIHVASDPCSPEPEMPPETDRRRFNISISSWFDKKEELDRIMERANVYIAPRMEEGIGQSFLEALSRGQCVVAADQGTMNEYILHGVNGLLFDSENPQPLDLSRAVELGHAGWKSACEGYARWKEAEDKIVKFILTPSEAFYQGKYNHFLNLQHKSINRTSHKIRTLTRKWPILQKAVPLMQRLRRFI